MSTSRFLDLSFLLFSKVGLVFIFFFIFCVSQGQSFPFNLFLIIGAYLIFYQYKTTFIEDHSSLTQENLKTGLYKVFGPQIISKGYMSDHNLHSFDK